MAEVGTYYISIMPEMSKFTGGINGALKTAGGQGGKEYNDGFASVLKGSAIGTALGNLAVTAGSAIASGMNVGVERIDILENFPKVMQSLGYESAEASKSIKLIQDRLDGLPTATQDVVALTQSIADSTGDLDLATKAALGFNDMMLAAGASTGEVTQAQGVLNRVLGKGNATVAQWQSLQSVMPAQLNAVAEEMLGAGGSTEELREKLNDGTISWNDFLAAIVKLDEEGSGSMASFYDTAVANSVGIGTALANIPNRIGAGWAEIYKAIGRENISGLINNMSYGIRDALTWIANGITYVRDLVAETTIPDSIERIGQAVGGFVSSLWTEREVELAKDMANALVDFAEGGLKWLADNSDVVVVALGAIEGALVGIVAVQLAQWLSGLPAAIMAINVALEANPLILIASAIAAVVLALITFFTQTETGKEIWGAFTTFLSERWEELKAGWAIFTENFTGAWNAMKSLVEGLPEWWGGVVEYWSSSWEEFTGYMADAGQKIKDDLTKAWEDIKNSVIERATAIKDRGLSIFNMLKDGITEKVQWAKDKIEQIVDGIKSLFDFEWSLPMPKLPKINWHMESIAGLLSIPVFDGISWMAKGGVFDTASIIGIGEAGREAALPLNDRTYGEIARGIAGQLGSDGGPRITITGNTWVIREEADIDRIAFALARKIGREEGALA